MAYTDFTLDMLIDQFGLQIQEDSAFLDEFTPVPISPLLRQELEENVLLARDISTEKARSEFIIAPVLVEVRRQYQRRISLFSGVEFTVDVAQGLRGVCDFLLSLSPLQLTIQAPVVVVVVEAKNENMKAGIAQCTVEMLAAQKFNMLRGRVLPAVYGAVTTGVLWRFLRLQDTTVAVDSSEYAIEQVQQIVGILVGMVKAAAGWPVDTRTE
jgi:hypothetical protein